MNVFLSLNHAPHYRELFLRKLGEKVNLTVYAKPCSTANLLEPTFRKNYKYFESFANPLFLRLGFQINRLEWKLLYKSWDKIILSWDLHHILRYVFFVFSGKKKSVIWMGHIYGASDSGFVKFLRKYFLNRSGGILTYSETNKQRLLKDGIIVPVWSFNNSEVSIDDIEYLPFSFELGKLKMLYVGRFQKRKHLNRLVELAKRNSNVEIIIAGNNMKLLENEFPEIQEIENIRIKGSALGEELKKIMKWCDIIVNPGHLGLLVVNGARFGRPILVDNSSQHAPEVIVAHEAEQFFIDWTNNSAIDKKIEELIKNRHLIKEAATRVVEIVKLKYTVEYMTQVYFDAINTTFVK